MMRGDVLPPKRQAVVDRLRRRIELYRRHHSATLPRYDDSANDVYEEQRQETLMLKQRYLESKAKKAKKNEHKALKESASSGAAGSSSTDSQKNMLLKMNKRSAGSLEQSMDQSTEAGQPDDKDQRPCKMPRNNSNAPDQSGIQQLSMEPQQIQNIPSFECIKQQSSSQAVPTTPKSPGAPGTNHASIPALRIIKKENDGFCGGNHSCARNQDVAIAAATNQPDSSDVGEKFLDVFPNLGLPEDPSKVWVDNPEILRHLIDDITNPSDLMTDFNFSYGMENVKDSVLEPCKSENEVHASSGDKKSGRQTSFVVSESFPASSSQQMLGSAFEQRVATTADSHVGGSASRLLPQQNYPTGNSRAPGQFSNSGLNSLSDFKLSEPSPAAQTLKQMAEQHQQHKQNHDKHSIGLPPMNPRGGSFAPGDNFEATLGSVRNVVFSTANTSLHPIKAMQTSNMFHSVGYGGQTMTTTTIQSNMRTEIRPMNSMTGVPFGKLNGSNHNTYAVSNSVVHNVAQMPSRMPEQQKCAPAKMGQYSSAMDEKTAFMNNFKASLAHFNEMKAAPSPPLPPLVKGPPQFTKRMSPSPMGQQAQMMMGQSGHAQHSANPMQQQQRTAKEMKDISSLNISSNPSYAEALAYSSGGGSTNSANIRGVTRTGIGSPQFQPQPQQQTLQHTDQTTQNFRTQYLDHSRPPCSSPADHHHHFVQGKTSVAPSHHLQHYGNRPPNPIAMTQQQHTAADTAHKQTQQVAVSVVGGQLASGQLVNRQGVPQYLHRLGHNVQQATLSSPPNQSHFEPANQINFTAPKMAAVARGQTPLQTAGIVPRHPSVSAASLAAHHKLVYTNAATRPQRVVSISTPQRDWQRMMAHNHGMQQQQQVCFQPQTSQLQQTRSVFSGVGQQQQQSMQQVMSSSFAAATLPPLPQLQIPASRSGSVAQPGNFSPSLTSSISDFNLEFLESIENSDSDLLNFDPVNSNFGILDDVLGGK
ncbi:mastermind-like protein 1 [Ixodes scapularis]|uniref:mastermind-like protein 1 n=1 Tax=Ixodes scapularis TaxID=6945 RepID=UPI001A9F3DEA|nr:mastermind-like protein 1 [Ixodes scapularis]